MLKLLRNREGLTQNELAEISGVSFRTIQNIEQNNAEINARGYTLKKLAKALRCTVDELLLERL